jgi:pimeloyl-ACP methyl ester carboxylesterase
MPFASDGNIKIHYEIEGKGHPLVLQHGFSGNIQEWYDLGYVEALKSLRRLILIDARGHGGSEKPLRSSNYSGKLMADDVVAVLDDIGIKWADYLGYSMGAWIGYNLIHYHPRRFTRFILGGMSPYPFNLDESPIFSFLRGLLKAGSEGGPTASIAWVEDLEGEPMVEYRRKGYYTMNFQSLTQLYKVMSREIATGTAYEPVETPCLIIVGEHDEFHNGAKRASENLPNAEFVSILGKDHIQTFGESSTIISHITKFLCKR